MPNANARKLRREATEAERRLWSALRDRRLGGYRFRRQYPIGPFIVDFACTKERLIIEADGGQHSDSATDGRRTAWLETQGWRVVRFWNNEILKNAEGVIDAILRELRGGGPSPGRHCAAATLSRSAGEGPVTPSVLARSEI